MILVDTSIWVGHFRRSDPRLVSLLVTGRVASCDVVLAELRLGSGMPAGVPELIGRLPQLPVPDTSRALRLLERHAASLAGAGIGVADLLIVACAAESGAPLMTSDTALAGAWRALGFAAP